MDDLHATLNSPFQSAKEITKPQVELVTEEEIASWGQPYINEESDLTQSDVLRLIATVRHYKQRVRDMEALLSLAQSHILALQTELLEARAKMLEAQQMIGEVK